MQVKVFSVRGIAAMIILAASLSPARAGAACETEANYGAVLSQSDIDGAVKALPPEALPDTARLVRTPAARVMLQGLPAVAQQGTAAKPGSPGTCEAQSFGYGLGSYTAARNRWGQLKWNPALAQNSTSSAWLYTLNQSRTGASCPDGSMSLNYLRQLTAYGAPSRAQVPYQADCKYLDKVDTQPLPGMDRFRIGSFAMIPVKNNPSAVDQIKAHLQARQAVAFTGLVLCGYGLSPRFENGVIYERETVPDSGHGQLLIGYDDKIGKPGEKGAFLVQNSFGLRWPPQGAGSAAPRGKAYWSYETFRTTQGMAAVAYPRSGTFVGQHLTAEPFGSPATVIGRAYQWTPASGDSAFLIMTHVFRQPVHLARITLSEPGGSPVSATAVYGQPISAGYSYLRRSDGKSFLPGIYRVRLEAEELGGGAITYTGNIVVSALGGSDPLPPASMSGAEVTGPTGARAEVTGAP